MEGVCVLTFPLPNTPLQIWRGEGGRECGYSLPISNIPSPDLPAATCSKTSWTACCVCSLSPPILPVTQGVCCHIIEEIVCMIVAGHMCTITKHMYMYSIGSQL